MGIWEIVVGAFVLIFSVIMIIVIILQEGHDSGLGTITGGADSFLKRGKAKTADALFAKITKYCAIVFFLLVVLLNALSYFGLTGKSDGTVKPTTDVSVVSEVSENGTSTAGTDESSTETTESAAESKDGTSKTEESAAAESSTEAAESSAEATESSTEAAESSTEVAESSAE